MAHSLSAKKRVRQNSKKRIINRARKSAIKTQIKHFETALKEGNIDIATQQLKLISQKFDKVSATSTLHKNTASRMKSRLTKKLNAVKSKQSS